MSAELPCTSANAQTCAVCGWHGATVGSSYPLRPGEWFETCLACGYKSFPDRPPGVVLLALARSAERLRKEWRRAGDAPPSPEQRGDDERRA
jgi:hypothetical protein